MQDAGRGFVVHDPEPTRGGGGAQGVGEHGGREWGAPGQARPMAIESGAARVVGEAFAEFARGDDEAGAGEGGELSGDDVVGEGT